MSPFISQSHTRRHAHTHKHVQFFFFHISISSLPATSWCNLLSSLHLRVYAKCPWQQEQTALIHHPRRGSIRWGEREMSVSSRWFPSFTERAMIAPSEGGLTVKWSLSQSDYPNLKTAVMLLAKNNRVLQCCRTLLFNRKTSTLKHWGDSLISRNQITAVCMSHCTLYVISRIISNIFLKSDNNQFHIGPD